MSSVLLAAMQLRRGVITREEAVRVTNRHVVDGALRSGAIVRLLPSVYALAELADDEGTLDLAALVFVPGSAASHTMALRILDVPHRAVDRRRHLTAASRHPVRVASLVVHRRATFVMASPHTLTRSGMPVVRLERALVESWPYLQKGERRGPAIAAVSNGRTTGPRLLAELGTLYRPHGLAEMTTLFQLLSLGCRSELELWGHSAAFDHPDLRPVVLQHTVRTSRGAFILDRAHVREMVGVELDGAAWHGSAVQRERDVRRDAALAALGWLIVRFTHARLREDPGGCGAELRDILERRRHQLRPA